MIDKNTTEHLRLNDDFINLMLSTAILCLYKSVLFYFLSWFVAFKISVNDHLV